MSQKKALRDGCSASACLSLSARIPYFERNRDLQVFLDIQRVDLQTFIRCQSTLSKTMVIVVGYIDVDQLYGIGGDIGVDQFRLPSAK